MKKKLVIIGANDFQNPLILKAKELGYETHVFAWQDGSVGERTSDYFYPISIVEKEQILEQCRKIRPDGIASIGSDLAVVTVNYVAEKLGLAGNPTSITKQCTNKFCMRQALQKYGVPTPRFDILSETDEIDISRYHFPVIVKPTDRSGSRAITKLFSEEGLREAVREACEVSFEKKAIIEEYIEGKEYSCECISSHGVHHFLAVTKKYTTGSPHYIETGHMEPAELTGEQEEKVKERVFQSLNALGIQNGASHSEFKIGPDGEIGMIEIGARMGGDCIGSDLVYLSTGNDFLKMVIDVACGNEITVETGETRHKAVIRFIFSQEDLDLMEQIRKDPTKEMWRVSSMEYENMGRTVDSSSRVGYYIYREITEEWRSI